VSPIDEDYADAVRAVRDELGAWLADPAQPVGSARALLRDLHRPGVRDLRVLTWTALVEVREAPSPEALAVLTQALGGGGTLLPAKKSAQHDALSFLYERLGLLLQGTSSDPGAWRLAIEELERATEDALGPDVPRATALRSRLDEMLGARALPGPAPGEDGGSEESLAREARRLRETSPADPLGYLLARRAAWLRIVGPPPVRDGRTFAAPPRPALRAAVENRKDPRRAVEACEAAVASDPLWLDPHRHAVTALRATGHDEAARAVELEVRAFVLRHPWLVALSFSDGSPGADAATRAWLDTLDPPVAEPAAGPRGDLLSALAEARRRLSVDDASGALALVRRAIALETTDAARYEPHLFAELYSLGIDVLSRPGAAAEPLRSALTAAWTARRWLVDHD